MPHRRRWFLSWKMRCGGNVLILKKIWFSSAWCRQVFLCCLLFLFVLLFLWDPTFFLKPSAILSVIWNNGYSISDSDGHMKAFHIWLSCINDSPISQLFSLDFINCTSKTDTQNVFKMPHSIVFRLEVILKLLII